VVRLELSRAYYGRARVMGIQKQFEILGFEILGFELSRVYIPL
jgi:hypothetical protein